MSKVTTRVLKNELSAWLHRVEQGERVTVLRDGLPVAALVPLSDLPAHDERRILAALQAQGHVRLPGGRPLGTFEGSRVPMRGQSASQMVLEDRR